MCGFAQTVEPQPDGGAPSAEPPQHASAPPDVKAEPARDLTAIAATGRAAPDAVRGVVKFAPAHAVWNGGMVIVAVFAGIPTVSMSAFAIFAISTVSIALAGHSVGMHRLLIHRSFTCSAWLRRLLIWLGVLVGMDGPLGMVRNHDLRDWAQRQPACHPYLAHGRPLLVDACQQLACRIELDVPPDLATPEFEGDAFLRLLQRTWMLQQIPLALLFFGLAGWGGIVWGVCMRIALTVVGHWFVSRCAHTGGSRSWWVAGAGVQGNDVPWAAVISMGESWHNNHHAYPGSACLGLLPGQADPGFGFIRVLERLGLVWSVVTPPGFPHALTPPPGVLSIKGVNGAPSLPDEVDAP